MLSATPPIALPGSSSPHILKRDNPHDHFGLKQQRRTHGPFVEDGDDSEEDQVQATETQSVEPDAKRRKVQQIILAEHKDLDAQLPNDPEARSRPEVKVHAAKESSTTQTAIHQEPSSSFWSSQRPLYSTSVLNRLAPASYQIKTCSGKATVVRDRKHAPTVSYESIVAARSKTKEGRAKRSYYGIEIHELVSAVVTEQDNKRKVESPRPHIPTQPQGAPISHDKRSQKSLLWTEKYRARKFVDLCGDDGTNRQVLRWLKKWDSLVFPGVVRSKPILSRRLGIKQDQEDEKPHRKILMLTGPPG